MSERPFVKVEWDPDTEQYVVSDDDGEFGRAWHFETAATYVRDLIAFDGVARRGSLRERTCQAPTGAWGMSEHRDAPPEPYEGAVTIEQEQIAYLTGRYNTCRLLLTSPRMNRALREVIEEVAYRARDELEKRGVTFAEGVTGPPAGGSL
jgi:hypothetical protein